MLLFLLALVPSVAVAYQGALSVGVKEDQICINKQVGLSWSYVYVVAVVLDVPWARPAHSGDSGIGDDDDGGESGANGALIAQQLGTQTD